MVRRGARDRIPALGAVKIGLPGKGSLLRLSTQLASVVAASVLTCSGIIIAETQIYDYFESERVIKTMPPAARRAVMKMSQKKTPEPAELIALAELQRTVGDDYSERSSLALLLFIATAVVGSFVAGSVLSRRLGQGLTNLADAASAVTQGDLSARAPTAALISREEAQLIDNFNTMAAALQHAERELRESTAAVAHELRTPLTVLSGRLHGIQDGVFEPGPEQIDSLIHQVDALTRLIDDLRTMSLVQSGQLALELGPIDLAEVVLPTIAAMAPDLHAVGIVVETRLRPAPMIGDAARLRQALAAALTNAQRYAPYSGALTIETGTSPQGIILRVLDRGPGVSEEIAARAFERFWRGEHSRDRARGGSGLGLSVVRAIAEAHGGGAALTPRAGGGAAFEMLLAAVPPRLDTVSTIA